MRGRAASLALLLAGLALAGCGAQGDGRPPAKPDMLRVHATDRQGQLTQGRVSTKSGELLILEPDGSVTQLALDSPAGRDAFALTEADLAALGVNLGLDLSHMPAPLPATRAERRQTAQQRALDAFAARSLPLLPSLPQEVPAESFRTAAVSRLDDGTGPEALVTVQADLARGVDAETAFAYATCALAHWAEANGATYARHVRSLSNRGRGETMRIESVFTLTSGARPLGLRIMEPKETLTACAQAGIPRA